MKKIRITRKIISMPQVDFEPSDYEHDAPTTWDKFSHSSVWPDIKKGFKGVNHKYALNILASINSRDFTQLPNVILLNDADRTRFYTVTPLTAKKFASVSSLDLGTIRFNNEQHASHALVQLDPTKKPPLHILRKSKYIPVIATNYMSFSVSKGLRVKYSPLLTKDKQPIMINGKMVLVHLDPKSSEYQTQLLPIFKLLFGYTPSSNDLVKMKSFTGIIDLLKHSKLPNKRDTFELFLSELIDKKLWGASGGRAQELERDSMKLDSTIKWTMVNYIMSELNVGNLSEIRTLANDYYKDWKGKPIDNINECHIPIGNKLSTIFKTVESKGSKR